jgi:flagellar hook-associated protein 2
VPTIDGIVSGFDTTGLINASLTGEYVQRSTLQSRIASYTQRADAVSTLNSKLKAVSEAAAALTTSSGYSARTVTSSGTGVTAASTGSASPTGTWAVAVGSLAKSTVLTSAGYADRSTLGTFSAGSFTMTVAGVTSTIAVDSANSSLDKVADLMNTVSGVQAYVVDTGASSDRYRLVVRGDETGAANAVSFSSADTGLALTEEVAAADASITIDGVISVSSKSNTVTDAIPGVRLTLNKAGETVTVGVAEDGSAIEGKVQTLVDAYNSAYLFWKTSTNFDSTKGVKGSLFGEGGAREAINGVASVLSGYYDVRTADSLGALVDGAYSSLASVGITTSADGTLAFNTTKFATARTADPDSMANLFTSANGPLKALTTRIDDTYVDVLEGTLTVRAKGLRTLATDARNSLTTLSDRIDSRTASLRAKFTAMETTLANLKSTQSYLTAVFASVTGSKK